MSCLGCLLESVLEINNLAFLYRESSCCSLVLVVLFLIKELKRPFIETIRLA
jgi:hypothetical protein